MKAWNLLYVTRNEDDFNRQWDEFSDEYKQYPVVIQYLKSTWLVHKEKLMDAWVCSLLHFNSSTTSRAESTNSYLKKFLSSSVGDLLTVFKQLDQAIEHQIYELRKVNADDKFKRPSFCDHALYSKVVFQVSSFALSEVQKHSEVTTTSSCTRTFTATMGLPCAHVVKDRLVRNVPLQLADFHTHWHVDRFSTAPSIPANELEVNMERAIPKLMTYFQAAPAHKQVELSEQLAATLRDGPQFTVKDPPRAKSKGRPSGALNRAPSTTRRDPSGFEFVEGSAHMKRKCGVCKRFGHNMRTCPERKNILQS